MNLKSVISTMAAAGLMAAANSVSAQTWTQTGADTNQVWRSIACSADGTRVAAAALSGGIYVSTNSGTTWQLSGAPVSNFVWVTIVSSADGNALAAVDPYLGYVFNSPDGGATWTSNYVSDQGLYSLAMSADGTRLIAATESNVLYVSTNSGAAWSRTLLAASPFGLSVACSADGTRLAAAANDAIFTSGDSGATWQMSGAPTNQYWSSIASSADGTRLVAGSYGGIFTSADSGASWFSNNVPRFGYVPLLASSADGSTLLAVPTDFSVARAGMIFISTNSGNTWISAGTPWAPWGGVAASADGSKLYAAAHSTSPFLLDPYSDGGIYTLQNQPAPMLNLASSGNGLLLSWIIPSTCMVLQSNSGAGPAGWTNVLETPSLNLSTLRYEVRVPAANGSGFYRLKSP